MFTDQIHYLACYFRVFVPRHIIGETTAVFVFAIDTYYRVEWFELHTELHNQLAPIFEMFGGQ